MHALFVRLCIVLISIHHFSAYSNDEPWIFMKEKNGVKSFKKHLPDMSLYAFRGEGVINAPIAEVMSVLLDNKRATEWIPKLSVCEVIGVTHWPTHFTQYSVFNAPWPVKDRFFVSSVKISVEAQSKTINIYYYNVSDLTGFTDTDFIKKSIQGSIEGSHYKLSQIDGSKSTYFTAISVVQPNGKIPVWLINWVGSSMPFDTMERLNKQLAKEDIKVPEEVKKLLSSFST